MDSPARVGSVVERIEASDDPRALETTSTTDVASIIEAEPIVCVVPVDDLPDWAGMDVGRTIRENAPQTPCVLFTGVSPGENDQLQNLGIVSYAGANMTAPNGQVIGQVCVLGREPRQYTEPECETLEQFAETVMEILELRQRLRDETMDGEDR